MSLASKTTKTLNLFFNFKYNSAMAQTLEQQQGSDLISNIPFNEDESVLEDLQLNLNQMRIQSKETPGNKQESFVQQIEKILTKSYSQLKSAVSDQQKKIILSGILNCISDGLKQGDYRIRNIYQFLQIIPQLNVKHATTPQQSEEKEQQLSQDSAYLNLWTLNIINHPTYFSTFYDQCQQMMNNNQCRYSRGCQKSVEFPSMFWKSLYALYSDDEKTNGEDDDYYSEHDDDYTEERGIWLFENISIIKVTKIFPIMLDYFGDISDPDDAFITVIQFTFFGVLFGVLFIPSCEQLTVDLYFAAITRHEKLGDGTYSVSYAQNVWTKFLTEYQQSIKTNSAIPKYKSISSKGL